MVNLTTRTTWAHLVQLTIKNIVLIQHVDLVLHEGLNILTGETGAGKSILLGALGLTLGARSDTRLIRHGAANASVSAEFKISVAHPLLQILNDHDIECPSDGECLIVRRTLTPDGRSRAFINDQPVSLVILKKIGNLLMEIHGQNDTHGLMDPKTHLLFLDIYANNSEMLDHCALCWKRFKQAVKKHEDCENKLHACRKEEEYLRHVVQELTDLAPLENEVEALSIERTSLMQSEKLTSTVHAIQNALSGTSGIMSNIHVIEKKFTQLINKNILRIDPLLEQTEKASIELNELISLLSELSYSIDSNPHKLEQVEERLFALQAASRKFTVNINDLTSLKHNLEQQLQELEQTELTLNSLQKQVDEAKAAYMSAAQKLSESRQNAKNQLDQEITAEFSALKMENALFKTHIDPTSENQWSAKGWDNIEFYIRTNPGSPDVPLARTASGGELSRIMLALKVVLISGQTTNTMVFDEVDAGIGGAVATAVGERLMCLSKTGAQVLVVTHSPQVAAHGDRHLLIEKTQENQTTQTSIKPLNDQERLDEIARMLSGVNVTDSARAAAKVLLSS